MSRAKLLQTIYSANREQVLEVLGWTNEQYYDFMLDMGMHYMADVLGMTIGDLKGGGKERMYWLWWVNHWNIHDCDIFLPSAYSVPDPVVLYKNIHNPKFLICHPSAVIMEAQYDTVINKMNKKSQKHTQDARNAKRQSST